jgi:hypothetical protein
MRSKARPRPTATRPRRHRARNDWSGQDSSNRGAYKWGHVPRQTPAVVQTRPRATAGNGGSNCTTARRAAPRFRVDRTCAVQLLAQFARDVDCRLELGSGIHPALVGLRPRDKLRDHWLRQPTGIGDVLDGECRRCRDVEPAHGDLGGSANVGHRLRVRHPKGPGPQQFCAAFQGICSNSTPCFITEPDPVVGDGDDVVVEVPVTAG